MSDKLIIEIDGNATGLTNELRKADARLNTFNRKISESNRALTGFQSKIGTSVNALIRLTASTNKLDTTVKSMTRTFGSLATSLTRLNTNANKSAASVAALGKSAGSAANHLNKLAASTQAVNTMMNSMSRRMNALNATVSALNTALRGLTRNITAHGVSVNVAAQGSRRLSTGLGGVAASSNLAAGGLLRLNRQSHGVAEGFRRTVAQITALRTITYQGLFWFAPLIYSIVKVNSAYEKQMVLLKNVARASGEAAKTQEAMQTREWLLKKAETNPFSLDQITNSFVKMRVGGIEPMNGSLQTLMDAIGSFGGGNAALDRAAVAIQQMGGKGVISMEELRQQLGEHVPTAAKAMAQGMEMSMGELYKAIEKGTVESTAALGKMFAVLRNMHINDAKKMMNTWDGLMARLGTAWSKFVVKVMTSQGGNSFIDKLKKSVEELIDWLNTPAGTNFAISVQNAMGAVLDLVVKILKFMYEFRDIIVKVAVLFALYWGGRFIIGALVGVTTAFRTALVVVKAMAAMMLVLTGRTTAAAAAQLMFGANVRRSAASMGLFNSAGALSIRTLAIMALRFVAAASAAALLVAAIWAVVSAINAKNAAEGESLRLKKAAEEGKVWEDADEANKSKARIQGLAQRYKEGGKWVTTEGGATFIKDSPAERARIKNEYWTGLNAHNLTTRNTRDQKTGNKEETYRRENSRGWEAGVGAISEDYERRMNVEGLSPEQKKKIDIGTTEGRLQFAESQLGSLRDKLAQTNDPAEKTAIKGVIEEVKSSIATDTAGLAALKAENNFTSKPGEGAGKKDKKPKGAGVDPAERYRNKFENEFGQTAELQNEYENLRDGKDTIFDAEAAQDAAQLQTRGKTIEQLKEMIVLEQQRQRELKKTIAVEKAILEIQDDTADRMADIASGYAEMSAGYDSIEQASKNFATALEREKREELAIVEARMAANEATAEQISQYKRLKMAIVEATFAKEAELIQQRAADAESASKEYRRSFLSGNANALEDLGDESRGIQEAINLTNSSPERYDAAKLKILNAIADAEDRRTAAAATNNQAAVQAAEAEIEVNGVIFKQLVDIQKLNEQGLPYLKERQAQIEAEIAARQKWNGAGAPLMDWAKEAQKGIDDLGGSLGSLVTDGLDGLVDGLMRGKLAFGDFVKSMIGGLIKIIIRALIAKAILSALGLGSTGSSGSVPNYQGVTGGGADSGFFQTNHTGGIVGTFGGAGKSADPAMFNFAQRYHTGGIVGLGSSEVPIIAEKGEGVFTKEQMKAMGGSQKGSNVEVNVINQTGTQAEVERKPARFDGEKWVEDIILKKMSQPGPVRTMLNAKRS